MRLVLRAVELTYEALDAQRLDLHVDQQAAVGLHQGRSQRHAGLGVRQLDDARGDAVDQTGWGTVRTDAHMVW